VGIAGWGGAAGERLVCIEAGGERLQSTLLPARGERLHLGKYGARRAASAGDRGERRVSSAA
jgi:hypothetical protein